MIRSMTAFARQELEADWGALTWELRSVNHRYLEVSLRLPDELRSLETAVRERAARRLGRGKLDCNLRYKPTQRRAALALDAQALDQTLAACEQIRSQLPDAAAINPLDLLRWPGVIQEESADPVPLAEAALALFDQALNELVATRDREGAQIHEILRTRLDAMEPLVASARARLPEVLARIRDKLRLRVAELTANPDPDRLEQELAYLAQKMDVDEELDRLTGHIAEVRRVFKLAEPVGRRLDFLMQEFNREANTLGSKSADSETTKVSVELKVLIEQMREQVQNVE
ncbi:MAG TPA: YicC/YloC family endoribonuclease [Gammaproteobacteria bacterium]|nr:YicC/YloC family endoribonuclease [Gammaproteobacteria bacterium]